MKIDCLHPLSDGYFELHDPRLRPKPGVFYIRLVDLRCVFEKAGGGTALR